MSNIKCKNKEEKLAWIPSDPHLLVGDHFMLQALSILDMCNVVKVFEFCVQHNVNHLHSLCAKNLWLTSNDHCVALCLSIHEVAVCSLHSVTALHRLCLTGLPWKKWNHEQQADLESVDQVLQCLLWPMWLPWSWVLLLLSLAVPTVSCSVLFLLEPPLPPNRLLGWLTMRDRVSRGFRAAFTVLAMLGLKQMIGMKNIKLDYTDFIKHEHFCVH